MRLILANQATASRRRVYFHLVDATDGMTPETGEAGGQPQISSNGAAFTNTGIGTLTAIGNGRYYADLTQAAVATTGTRIETRYQSAETAECPGESVQVVAFDPDDAASLGLSRLDTTVSSRATVAEVWGELITNPLNGQIVSYASTLLWWPANLLGYYTDNGLNTLFGWLKALASKVATLPSGIGGTYDNATDSQEALRERGDAAWADSGVPPSAASVAEAVLDAALDSFGDVRDALIAARAQASGAWEVADDTLTLYLPDGTTPLVTFDLAPADGPYVSRTPQ